MRILWYEQAWEDYLYWQRNDPGILERVNSLVKDIGRSPFRGIGKPEPLKAALSGWWSRRITDEHRFVYRVTGRAATQVLEVLQCRYHY